MEIAVYTSSKTYQSYVANALARKPVFSDRLPVNGLDSSLIHLLHAPSFPGESRSWVKANAGPQRILAVGSDKPGISEMLDYAQIGVKAYYNCFMQAVHYRQLLRLLENGQSWFPPHLLQQTFQLAQQAAAGSNAVSRLDGLTEREKQVAESVSKGLTNRQIAHHYKISESTVKTHLTSIFKKLQLKDRVGLVLHLK